MASHFPRIHRTAHLPLIHPKLHLTSFEGAKRQKGKGLAIVAVAFPETVSYMKNHDADYRAYVIAGDDPRMGQTEFEDVFETAGYLLKQQLDRPNIKKVVCHCRAGCNRSATAIMTYVLQHTNQDPNKALQHMRLTNMRERGIPALINTTFQKRLRGLKRKGGGKTQLTVLNGGQMVLGTLRTAAKGKRERRVSYRRSQKSQKSQKSRKSQSPKKAVRLSGRQVRTPRTTRTTRTLTSTKKQFRGIRIGAGGSVFLTR